MRAIILQHVPFERPGSIISWLERRGATIHYCRLYEATVFPDPATADLLVIMGGPMSVNDQDHYPWLEQEKEFIRQAVQTKLPILGICLGAQLIASVLGAPVYPNQHKEIGWFPVSGVSAGSENFHFPQETAVFHWHGETFDLPDGAVRLAESKLCHNQAFQLGRRTIGLQFHLEVTPTTVELMIENCRDELVEGRAIQREEELRAVPDQTYAVVNSLMADLLTYLTSSH